VVIIEVISLRFGTGKGNDYLPQSL
jgi:hypothetical protein